MDKIQGELLRGNIDTILLKCLFDCDKYGNEICKEVENLTLGQFEIKLPTLYSALTRLEKLGLVSVIWESSVSGGKRKYFHLTDDGKEYFAQKQKEWEFERNVVDKMIAENIFSTQQSTADVYRNNNIADEPTAIKANVISTKSDFDDNILTLDDNILQPDDNILPPSDNDFQLQAKISEKLISECAATNCAVQDTAHYSNMRTNNDETYPIKNSKKLREKLYSLLGNNDNKILSSEPTSYSNATAAVLATEKNNIESKFATIKNIESDFVSTDNDTTPTFNILPKIERSRKTSEEHTTNQNGKGMENMFLDALTNNKSTNDRGTITLSPLEPQTTNSTANNTATPFVAKAENTETKNMTDKTTAANLEQQYEQLETAEYQHIERRESAWNLLYSEPPSKEDAFESLAKITNIQRDSVALTKKREQPIDYTTITDTTYEYKSTLSALFPISESTQKPIPSNKPFTLSLESQTPGEINNRIERLGNGLVIRRHSREQTSAYKQKFYCYSNRLNLANSMLMCLIMLIEIVACYCGFVYYMKLLADVWLYYTAAGLAIVLPIFMSIKFFIRPFKIQRIDTRRKNIFLLPLILTVQAIIVIFAVEILVDRTLFSGLTYLSRQVLPCIISLNFIIYSLCTVALQKTKKFAVK